MPATRREGATRGVVTFVGAGPGDPELITRQAERLLGEADLVLFPGDLIASQILDLARPTALRVDGTNLTLGQQVDLLRVAAERGQAAVRLHTGDPTVYGDLYEQLEALRAAGVVCRVAPGVSSALAAAAVLGLDLTPSYGTQTVILSRMQGATAEQRTSFGRLARHRASMVILLSVGMLAQIVGELRAAGYPEATPVSVAYRVGWPDELLVRGSLASIVQRAEQAGVTDYGVIIVTPAGEGGGGSVGDTLDGGARRDRRVGIVTLTEHETRVGQRLLQRISHAVLYGPQAYLGASAVESVEPYAHSVRPALHRAFMGHRAVVTIMPANVALLELGPLLTAGSETPDVVLVDEAASAVVSLLSGPSGGVNDLAAQVAASLGIRAVLSASEEVFALPDLRRLGEERGWLLDSPEGLDVVQQALVSGQTVGVYQDCGARDWWPSSGVAARPDPPNLLELPSLRALRELEPSAALLITYRVLPTELRDAVPRLAVYRPKCLVLGVACEGRAAAEEAVAAVDGALQSMGLASTSVDAVVVTAGDPSEPAMEGVCARRGWRLERLADGVGDAEGVAKRVAGAEKLLGEVVRARGVTIAAALVEHRLGKPGEAQRRNESEELQVAEGKGLVIVHTGHGKGKTTAALGLVLRAWGHGLRPCVIQFVKSEKGRWGEVVAAERLGIEWHTLGEGFTWMAEDMGPSIRKARDGWTLAQQKIASDAYDLLVLDEFTYPLRFGWVDATEAIAWMRAHKPPRLHLVITGRDAPDELVQFADLVTEMTNTKHPFDQGVRAQRGIEF